MIWQVIFCAILVISQSDEQSSLLTAEELFRDVYGKKIEAAKTPEAKAALARELLDLARKETDHQAKRLELEYAKKLAVEGRDVAVAIQTVKELAAIPRDKLPTDLIAEAESMWLKAKSDEDRLEALELYFRARDVSPLLAQKWRERIDDMIQASIVILSAKAARLIGSQLFYDKDLDVVRGWKSITDYMEWSVDLRGGTYTVAVSYAADPPMAPESLLGFGVFPNEKAKKPLSYAISQLGPSGPWFTPTDRQFGVIKIPKDGSYICRLYVVRKPPEKLNVGVIALRSITLRREW